MRTKAIVVGVDGSEPGRAALAWAVDEAQRRGLSLTLVYANLPIVAGGRHGTTSFPSTHDHAAAGERLLAREEEHARDLASGLTIVTEVRSQAPALALLEASADADLVVVGSRGRSATRSLALGSVSVHVAAHAACPVVVVRGGSDPQSAIGPVVVGVDASASAETAVGFAFEEATVRGTHLLALHTVDDDDALVHEMCGAPDAYLDELLENAEHEVRDVVSRWREKFPDVDVRHHIGRGHPVPALLSASRTGSLLVVGSRGRGQFLGMLLGSVGAALIREAQCPVAVVR